MNSSTEPPCPFFRCSIELLEQILLLLSVRDLLRCRLVHRRLNQAIMTSPSLQYQVDLFTAALQDVPSSAPVVARHDMLKAHQAAWRSLQWVEEHKFTVPHPKSFNLTGGVLVFIFFESTAVRFIRLPSVLRRIKMKDWTIENLPAIFASIAVYPTTDLLVGIEPSIVNTSLIFRIHLLTMSHGMPHPLASISMIQYRLPTMNLSTRTSRTVISGSHLAILIKAETNHFNHNQEELEIDHLVVYNWKSGSLIMHFALQSITSVSFLSDTRLILGVIETKIDSIQQMLIRMYDLVSVDSDNPDPRVTFRLPTPDGRKPDDIKIHSSELSVPMEVYDLRKEVPFVAMQSERIFAIATKALPSLVIITSASTFLAYAENAPGRFVDWRDWAGNTRLMFPNPNIDGMSRDGLIHGTKMIGQINAIDKTLSVFDFNSRNIRRFVGSSHDIRKGRRRKTVLTPSSSRPKWMSPRDKVHSKMVYASVIAPIPDSSNSNFHGALLDEDNIIVITDDTTLTGSNQTFHLLTF